MNLGKKHNSLRIKELRNSLNLTQQLFASEIGATREVIANIESEKTNITAEQIAKVIELYNVNPTWLLTGEGKMISSSNDSQELLISTKTNVVLYDIDASAGGLIAAQNEKGELLDQWFIPELIGEHIAINVLGNSMSPTMEEGDKIVAKECYRNDLRDGQIYIVVSTDNNVRVKRLRMGNEVLMLWSDNVAFVPRHEQIKPDDIIKLFHVVMVCKVL